MFHVKQGVARLLERPTLPPFALSPEKGCADIDPDIFYPARYTVEQTAEAKRICRSCPFLQECGVWAILTNEGDGVWGSLTPKERKEIREQIDGN